MHVCVCVCGTLPEMMFCFLRMWMRAPSLCAVSSDMHVRHTLFWERVYSSNFERGKESYFTVWLQRNRYTRSHQANYSKLTKRAWKLGNFLVHSALISPSLLCSLWKKACIVEIFWYNSQYVIQLCWLVDRAECSSAQSLDYLQVNMCVDSTK